MHPPTEMTWVFSYNWYSAKKTMWFIGVEVEQETSAPPPKKNPGSPPVIVVAGSIPGTRIILSVLRYLRNEGTAFAFQIARHLHG